MKLSERLRKTVELKATSASIWDNWEVSGWKELVDEVAQLEAENERLAQLETEIKKILTPDPNFKGTLPSWEPIKVLLTGEKNANKD